MPVQLSYRHVSSTQHAVYIPDITVKLSTLAHRQHIPAIAKCFHGFTYTESLYCLIAFLFYSTQRCHTVVCDAVHVFDQWCSRQTVAPQWECCLVAVDSQWVSVDVTDLEGTVVQTVPLCKCSDVFDTYYRISMTLILHQLSCTDIHRATALREHVLDIYTHDVKSSTCR